MYRRKYKFEFYRTFQVIPKFISRSTVFKLTFWAQKATNKYLPVFSRCKYLFPTQFSTCCERLWSFARSSKSLLIRRRCCSASAWLLVGPAWAEFWCLPWKIWLNIRILITYVCSKNSRRVICWIMEAGSFRSESLRSGLTKMVPGGVEAFVGRKFFIWNAELVGIEVYKWVDVW